MKDWMLRLAMLGGVKALIPTPGHFNEFGEVLIAAFIVVVLWAVYEATSGKRKKELAESHKDQAASDSASGSIREITC